jgi:hypothetical protein
VTSLPAGAVQRYDCIGSKPAQNGAPRLHDFNDDDAEHVQPLNRPLATAAAEIFPLLKLMAGLASVT